MDNKYEYKRPANEAFVEVTVPSGNIFLFHKPSVFTTLFQFGKLPQAMANGAFEKWKLGNAGGVTPQDEAEMMKLIAELTGLMLKMSVNPKLVAEPTTTPGELWLSTLSDEDCTFLLYWVASGGNSAAIAATFPGGRRSSTMAGSNRKERRAAAKQAGGVN